MTMKSLFDTVFKACALNNQEQQDKVLGLRTTLYWTENAGFKKYLMVKREFEDDFATFLQMIDTSQCWEKDGYCYVGIDLVMK